MVVAKFGGSSMAKPKLVAEIVSDHPKQTVIICSAPGKSARKAQKVTDILFKLAYKKSAGELDSSLASEVVSRFAEIVSDLNKSFADKLLKDLKSDLNSSLEINYIVSRGEYYSALAFAERTGFKFIDAKELFIFDTNGKFMREKSKEQIKQKLANKERYVVPGYYGTDKLGKTHLFGRGGSDRSGAILAASLGRDYENWTDVDGIMNADPLIVEKASVVTELTYEEIREGAHGGTGVFMGDSILDLEHGDSDCIIKNTFNQEASGTRIKKSRNANEKSPVVALSARVDLVGLRIHDLGMRDTKGYLAKIMQMLEKHNISIEHMPAAQDSITITFHDKKSLDCDQMQLDVAQFLVSPSAYSTITECGVVYMVGEQLRKISTQQQVVIEALQQLEESGIPILAIMMHPDSPSVAIILRREETNAAQKSLFSHFIAV